MCGRYTLARPEDEFVEVFDVPGLTFQYRPRFNIAPGQEAPVVAEDRRGRRAGLLKWGFVPSWADQVGRGYVNARAETADSTPSFRDAFAHRRCLIPADGFYEWRRDGKRAVPYWIYPNGGGLLAMAGIWETYRQPGRPPYHSFAILTVAANDDVRTIHHRMPVLLPPEYRAGWLDTAIPLADLRRMIEPAPAGTLLSREVSPRVNSVTEDDAGLVAAIQ